MVCSGTAAHRSGGCHIKIVDAALFAALLHDGRMQIAAVVALDDGAAVHLDNRSDMVSPKVLRVNSCMYRNTVHAISPPLSFLVSPLTLRLAVRLGPFLRVDASSHGILRGSQRFRAVIGVTLIDFYQLQGTMDCRFPWTAENVDTKPRCLKPRNDNRYRLSSTGSRRENKQNIRPYI